MVDSEKEIKEGKFFAAISYVSFFCIVTMVLKKNNNFALYHAKHGLVLFVMEVATFILSIIPVLGVFLKIAGITLFLLVSLWGILQSLQGNRGRLPVLSDIADNIVL